MWTSEAEGGPFIRALPLVWFERAATLPGKAVHLGLALFFMSGLCASPTVRLAHRVAARFGVGRAALGSALRGLESAGLVTVVRSPGRSPRVTIDLTGGFSKARCVRSGNPEEGPTSRTDHNGGHPGEEIRRALPGGQPVREDREEHVDLRAPDGAFCSTTTSGGRR
jgi:hypothetical protein